MNIHEFDHNLFLIYLAGGATQQYITIPVPVSLAAGQQVNT